jgi:hypothetical protein
MRYRVILLLSICLSINAFEAPVVRTPGGVRIKPAAAKRLFPETESISEDQQLFDYIHEQLPEAVAQKLIDILIRPKTTNVRNETFFKDLYWTSNDGHDLRKLAADVIELLNSNRVYAKLKRDIQFIFLLSVYLVDRYSDTTTPLRAAIPFESLPATTRFVAERINLEKNSEDIWCKELALLERWLDTAQAPTINDPFYEKGILLLINGLPKNHPLLTKDDSCIKNLLFHAVRGNYERIFSALLKKEVNVNWKNAQDETPLHKAAFDANESMVQKLLNAGAQVNVRTIYNQTALDFAKLSPYANKDTIIKMLTDKGAQSGESL